jgi:hypothetical protein
MLSKYSDYIEFLVLSGHCGHFVHEVAKAGALARERSCNPVPKWLPGWSLVLAKQSESLFLRPPALRLFGGGIYLPLGRAWNHSILFEDEKRQFPA